MEMEQRRMERVVAKLVTVNGELIDKSKLIDIATSS